MGLSVNAISRGTICGLVWVASGVSAGADIPPGVPRGLAIAREAAIRDVHYTLRLRVPEAREQPVTGSVDVRLRLPDGAPDLILDFDGARVATGAARLDGRPAEVHVANGHIVFPGPLSAGVHNLRVEFTAADAPLNRNDDFLYTLFVPARARRAFPCFDQPDLKARLTLMLDLPAGWEAVANGAERARTTGEGRVRVRFAETEPLPTYLMAFAAGRLSVDTARRGGRTYRMFHRETDAAKLARNREAVFDLHAAALSWMEEYTGIPYPWPKFDFFLAPAFQFSGMEHAGAVFYNGEALLLEPSATTRQLLGRASLIAHEVAHMWFGDLVTMRWFDDVWMKEVFANFMAAKIVNPSFPAIDHDLRFLLTHYRGAYEVDRTAGTHPIRQPLDNLSDAGSLYGAIIYQKAPVVMRQLERLMGESALREGLRAYLSDHTFGNASWSDLIDRLDPRSPDDLHAWSRVWVSGAGRPEIAMRLKVADGRIAELAFDQRDPTGEGQIWPQALEVEIGHEEGLARIDVVMRGAHAEVADAAGLPAPHYVLPTGGGWGYGRFVLGEATLAWLLEHLPAMPAALSRGAAWMTLWEEMLEGRVAPASLATLALAALETEEDALNVERLLTDLESLYWRFLPPAGRDALTRRVEAALRSGLARAGSPTLKGAWFGSYVRLARTAEAVAWLTAVWRGDERVPGLPLGEPELTSLAQELAVRQAAGWEEILETQQQRITNPDRRARFAFVRPALDADPAVRARFFASLARVEHRRHEPWVLDAVGYLHHPLRVESAIPLVAPGLALLEEIQRTGDIFFPYRWADATLRWHRSSEVADVVRAFLESRPEYPDRLRRIILQTADDLMRIAGAGEWRDRR